MTIDKLERESFLTRDERHPLSQECLFVEDTARVNTKQGSNSFDLAVGFSFFGSCSQTLEALLL